MCFVKVQSLRQTFRRKGANNTVERYLARWHLNINVNDRECRVSQPTI